MITMVKKFALVVVALLLAALPVASPAFAADTVMSTNLIANPSVETAASESAPESWANSVWGVSAGAMSYENEGHTGTRSVKTALTSYTDGAADWYFADVNVTPGQVYTYSHWYKSDVETQLDAQVTAADNTVSHHFIATVPASPSAWSQVTAQFTAPANAKSVTIFQPLNKVGYVQVDDASLTTTVVTSPDFSNAIVSLTFDDGWLDQYTKARPLMNQNNLDGTYYLLTNTVDFEGYMTVANMQTLGQEGNELTSHTVSHADLATLGQAELTAELTNSQTQLRAWFGATGVANNFASPYGSYNATTVNEIKKYYRSHRSTDVGYNSKANLDVYNIKVQNILDSTTSAEVAAWVDEAIATKTWLVLVYHRIDNDTPNEEDYNVSSANLATELAYIKNSGVAVKTVEQALNELLPQYTTPTPATKPGDVNNDNVIDALDLSLVLSNWNKTGATKAQGDLNSDGTVDGLDLSLVLANWSK